MLNNETEKRSIFRVSSGVDTSPDLLMSFQFIANFKAFEEFDMAVEEVKKSIQQTISKYPCRENVKKFGYITYHPSGKVLYQSPSHEYILYLESWTLKEEDKVIVENLSLKWNQIFSIHSYSCPFTYFMKQQIMKAVNTKPHHKHIYSFLKNKKIVEVLPKQVQLTESVHGVLKLVVADFQQLINSLYNSGYDYDIGSRRRGYNMQFLKENSVKNCVDIIKRQPMHRNLTSSEKYTISCDIASIIRHNTVNIELQSPLFEYNRYGINDKNIVQTVRSIYDYLDSIGKSNGDNSMVLEILEISGIYKP